jgi:hypothetical protein
MLPSFSTLIIYRLPFPLLSPHLCNHSIPESDAPAPVSPTALFASVKKFATLLSLPGLSINGGSGPSSPSGGGGSGETNTSVGTGNLAYDAVQLVNDAVCVALHFNAMLTSVFPDQVCARVLWVGVRGWSECVSAVCVFPCVSLCVSCSGMVLIVTKISLDRLCTLSLSFSISVSSLSSLSNTHTQVYFLFASLHRGTADEGDEFRNHLLRVPAQLLAQVLYTQMHTRCWSHGMPSNDSTPPINSSQ